MIFSQSDIDKALQFADTVRLTASLDSADGKTINFQMSSELPGDLQEDVRDLLDIAIQYYQRSIFTGEYLMEDDSPPTRRSGEPIDDINFYLSYYKTKLIEELKKAFGSSTDSQSGNPADGPKLTPYAQVMLEYRKKMMAKKK